MTLKGSHGDILSIVKSKSELLKRRSQILMWTNVTASHQRRIQRLKLLMSTCVGDHLDLIAAIATHYKPSTALTYLRTLLTLIPEMKQHPTVKLVMDSLGQKATVSTSKQAKPFVPREIQDWMEHESLPMRTLIHALWTTASRYGDLQHISRITFPKGNIAQIMLDRHKGDRYGKRRLTKLIPVPTWLNNFVLTNVLLNPPSYDQLMTSLKATFPNQSSYSIRRGAISYLKKKGFTDKIVSQISGHAVGKVFNSLRRYYDPALEQKEVQELARLSLMLSNSINPHIQE